MRDAFPVDSVHQAPYGPRAEARPQRATPVRSISPTQSAQMPPRRIVRRLRVVMYDASLKIWVEGYKAFSKGRYIGPTGECTVFEEGAKRYWEGKALNRNRAD